MKSKRSFISLFVCLLLISGSISYAETDSNEVYESVIEKGWISREEFNSGEYVSRAQAIKTILRMANLVPIEGYLGDFTDTAGHPDREFINQARQYGIVKSKGNNQFQPYNLITKKELIIWLERVFNLPDTVNYESSDLNDNVGRSDWEAYFAINKFLELGMIPLDASGEFHPNDHLTMDEFALIIDRLSGVGIRDLQPVRYEGQNARRKILEPR